MNRNLLNSGMSLVLAVILLCVSFSGYDFLAKAQDRDGASDGGKAELSEILENFTGNDFDAIGLAAKALAESGSQRALPILSALLDGELNWRKSDKALFITTKEGRDFHLEDALSGEDKGLESSRNFTKVKTKNKLRSDIRALIASLTLTDPDPEVRAQAVSSFFDTGVLDDLPLLQQAITRETQEDIRDALLKAQAAITVRNQSPEAETLNAIGVLGAYNDRRMLSVLIPLKEDERPKVAEAASQAVKAIEDHLEVLSFLQDGIYGLSLASVLLLAAIGLAITFGVMGVINMAHGEMVMIGAYVTYVVQTLIRDMAPALFDYSLLIALPLAFATSGVIGIILERGVIRHLYGRPLETLLATWGVSLILQQVVRVIFGASQREVGNPAFMSGSIELAGLTLTTGRLYIIIFSVLVFISLLLVIKKSFLGLQIRAVVQNRAMAAGMGIRVHWVDALTFGLGSGIAGIAGVALSQIDKVSPNLGQAYIVDSFMVVVFGGVGNLWGTLVAALSLGVVNKILEPFAGAVLGKILVLVCLILFIQKRPQGLFALKGRAVQQ